jgi:hypothetical protein
LFSPQITNNPIDPNIQTVEKVNLVIILPRF